LSFNSSKNRKIYKGFSQKEPMESRYKPMRFLSAVILSAGAAMGNPAYSQVKSENIGVAYTPLFMAMACNPKIAEDPSINGAFYNNATLDERIGLVQAFSDSAKAENQKSIALECLKSALLVYGSIQGKLPQGPCDTKYSRRDNQIVMQASQALSNVYAEAANHFNGKNRTESLKRADAFANEAARCVSVIKQE
jgi:hypothetical protein